MNSVEWNYLQALVMGERTNCTYNAIKQKNNLEKEQRGIGDIF